MSAVSEVAVPLWSHEPASRSNRYCRRIMRRFEQQKKYLTLDRAPRFKLGPIDEQRTGI